MPSPGSSLGKYVLSEVIGRGGMGEVYKARQADLGRTVAIKTLLAGEQASEEFLERFRREARVTAELVHPGIVQIYDVGVEGKLHYIVMEHVEGRSLKEALAERKPGVRESLEIARSVARTLQFAHERGVIHRDVKPANLMIDGGGKVRILDFGLARSTEDGKGLTATGAVIGTPYYMSPEQAFNAPDEVDARTDVYSLGAVLYEMLTGRPIFDGGTVLAILRKIEEEDPKPPGISPEVDALVMRALAKDRERRFRSAGEMADAIDAWLAGTAAPAPKPRLLPYVAVAAAGILLVVVIWAIASKAGSRDPSPEGQLKYILEVADPLSDEALELLEASPELRRLFADHFIERGRFSIAAHALEGYDRVICELASVRVLQRFFSPALFPVGMEIPEGLEGPRGLLMDALRCHFDGRQEAADALLEVALNKGAPERDALLVRAHLELYNAMTAPDEEEREERLAALAEGLEEHDDLALLPLRALAEQGAGESDTAFGFLVDRIARAPYGEEQVMLTHLLLHGGGDHPSSYAHFSGMDDGEERLLAMFLRLLAHLQDPGVEELRHAPSLEELEQHRPHPAALFLIAVDGALNSRWEEAQNALGELESRVEFERLHFNHEVLHLLLDGVEERTPLYLAASELQMHVGREEAALDTLRLVTAEEFPEEEREEILRDKHFRMAILLREDEEAALHHLEEALKRGLPVEDVREDEAFEELQNLQEFKKLLKRHEE